MANELSLDQLYAPSTTPQAGQPPAKPAEPKAPSNELTLDELYAQPAKPAAPAKPEQKVTAKGLALGGLSVAATVGDMILSIPGGIAGAAAEEGMYAEMQSLGINREGAGEASKAFGDYVSEHGSTHVLSSLVGKLSEQTGEPPDKNLVERAMGKIGEWIDKGAVFWDAKSGHRVSADEFRMEANLLMNIAGAKGLGKFGPHARIGAEGPELVSPKTVAAEKAAAAPKPAPPTIYVGKDGTARVGTLDPIDGQPTTGATEAMKRQYKTANKSKMMSEKDLGKVHKAWKDFNDGATEVEARRTVTARAAKQMGAADPKLLAIMAGVTTGALLAHAYPEKADDATAFALGLSSLGIGPKALEGLESASLGSLLGRGTHTLKTLENLNENHTEFPVKRLREELRRPEISKGEKDLFEAAIGHLPPDAKLSAHDLVRNLDMAAGRFVLKPKETEVYGDYGLDRIDRPIDAISEPGQAGEVQGMRDDLAWHQWRLQNPVFHERAAAPNDEHFDDYPYTARQAQTDLRMAQEGVESLTRELAQYDEEQLKAGAQNAHTKIWQSTKETNVSNHFDDPRYFAHSRHFTEDGVDHVTELQSDLVQKNKPLSAEVIKEGEARYAKVHEADEKYYELLNRAEEEYRRRNEAGNPLSRAERERWSEEAEHVQEEASKIRDEYSKWRMETGYYRGAEALGEIAPMWKDWHKRIVREVLAHNARQGGAHVRFATADTVAKVEAWPRETERAARIRENLESYNEAYNRAEERFQALSREINDLTQRGINTPKDRERFHDLRGRADEVLRHQSNIQEERNRLHSELQRVLEADIGNTEAPFFKHFQGIYDRYKKDVEPFLGKLGGKVITDKHGHTWIEVPTGATKGRAAMFGRASTDMMKTIAGAALGLTVAGQFDSDNPIVTAVTGALLGVGAAHFTVGGIKKAFEIVGKKDERIRINGLTEAHETNIVRAERESAKFAYAMSKAVPRKADRVLIHRAIDEGKVAALPPKLQAAAQMAVQFYAAVAAEAHRVGVLDQAMQNYSTHLWADKTAAKSILDKKQAAMSGKSRFNKQRAFLTMAEGKAAGLEPLTEDIAEVAAIYGREMGRTIANAKLLQDLKMYTGPKGEALIAKTGRAPAGYVPIDSPQLRNHLVHPDIAPSLKFLYEAEDPGGIVSALNAVNIALKRNAVSYSLFHAKSLVEAGLVAGHPIKSIKAFAQAAAPKIFGTNRMLEMLRTGQAGDLVDDLLKSGLKISFERGESADIDVGGGFYKGMQVVQQGLDKALPFGVGKGLAKGYIRVNHAVDNFMWAHLHASLKLEVAAAKAEALLQNAARRGKPLTKSEAYRLASKYTNDVFGGLNWQRLAESSRTAWGRNFALKINSRGGRVALNVLLFAPDWALSTTRAFVKALPQSLDVRKIPGAVRGVFPFQAVSDIDLYRQQLIRLGAYYVTALNAINNATSGHNIWDNDDPTRIDLGDGRTIQAMKHSFEAYHLITHPAQTALSKMGIIPKEAMEQALGVEYLSAKGRMPPMKSHVGHLAKNVVPIGAQQFKQGAFEGFMGLAGAPVLGMTKDQKRQAHYARIAEQRAQAKAKREERHKKLLEQYKKQHGLQ